MGMKMLPKLTRKQAAFVREIVENPRQSNTDAAMIAYRAKDKVVASAIAAENLRKPSIISHLSEVSDLVEETLSNTVRDWGRSENSRRREIGQNAAMYIHDKVHGKATQRVETTSQAVVITIDLSGQSLSNDVIEADTTD